MDKRTPMELVGNMTARQIEPRTLTIALKTGIGIRSSLARSGVAGLSEFVNGIILGASLLAQNHPGDSDLEVADAFDLWMPDLVRMFQRGERRKDVAAIVNGGPGEVQSSASEMMVTAGLAVEGTIMQIGQQYDLDKEDLLAIPVVIVAAALHGISGSALDQDNLAQVLEEIREKAELWNEMIPSLVESGVYDDLDDESEDEIDGEHDDETGEDEGDPDDGPRGSRGGCGWPG